MSWAMLNLIVLLVYLALMIYLGIISERGVSKTATGYLLAERSLTLPWIIMSVFATATGTLAYIGTVGMIYQGGVIDLWFEFFWCIGIPLMALLFVRKLRTSGIISCLDSITFRFGPRTLLVLMVFLVVLIPFQFAHLLKGAGLTFRDMFPTVKIPWLDPLAIGAIVAMAVMAAYLAIGGFKACVATDMFQGILCWGAMVVPLVATLLILGHGSVLTGWDNVISHYTDPKTEQLLFRETDFLDPASLAKELQEGRTTIARHLGGKFSPLPDAPPELLRKELCRQFNCLLQSESLYEEKAFRDAGISESTQKLLEESAGTETLRVKRLLLEQAFRGQLLRSPSGDYLKMGKVVGPTAPAAMYSYSLILAMLILNTFLIMLPTQFYGSRYMAAKTDRIARQGPILALILTTVPYGLLINFTGLTFKAYAPEIPGDELFTGTLAKLAREEMFPMILSSILLISLFAVVMSTVDSFLMAKVTDFVRGIYHLWVNPKATDRQLIRVSRMILGLLAVASLIAVFYMPQSIWFLEIAVAEVIGPILFVYMIGAFLVRRATWQGAIAGGATGSLLALFLTACLTGFEGQYPRMIVPALQANWPDWLHQQFLTYPIGMAVFFCVSYLTPPQRPEHIERLFSTGETMDYVQKYGFDRPYLVVPEAPLSLEGLEIQCYRSQRRAYGPERSLRDLARRLGLKFYPAYRQFESWQEVFTGRLCDIYPYGLDVARQREIDKVGQHERPAAKVIGAFAMAVAVGLYFAMFWTFPLKLSCSLALYIAASALMFAALCVFYEDYGWARKIVDIAARFHKNRNFLYSVR